MAIHFILLILIFGPSINGINACKATYQYSEYYQALIPDTPLDICLNCKENGSMCSYYLSCGANNQAFSHGFYHLNCVGFNDFIMKQNNNSWIDAVKCDDKKCDYALTKISYLKANSCEPNDTDFELQADVVNFCVKTQFQYD